MWICLNDSFLSIVAHRDNPEYLLVRSRVKGHIEAVFPTAKVFTDEKADYFYRAEVLREQVSLVIAGRIEAIEYDNFKSSVKDEALHNAYLDFWTIMYRLQRRFLYPQSNELKPAAKKVGPATAALLSHLKKTGSLK